MVKLMTGKFKVAVIAACPFPYPRGTPVRILRMTEGLVARGHEVHVFAYHLAEHAEDLPFVIHRIPNITTYRKFSPGPTYQKIFILDVLLAINIFRALRREKFDVIHAHHFEGALAGLPAARLCKTPLIFDMHTLLSSELPYYPRLAPKWALTFFGRLLDHWLPKQADHVVTVTESIRRQIMDRVGVEAEKITTVYGGVEKERFPPPASPQPADSSQTLIYTGNLAPYQGVDLMLQAFRKVLERFPKARLKVVTNSSMDPYHGLASALELNSHIDVVKDDYFQLSQHLHAADIALNPRAHCDGLPLKLLNYMATGRAIVSFAGSAKTLSHGQTALIVPDGDTEAFAAAIIKLLEDPQYAAVLGRNARSHVQAFFVWENSIMQLEKIYHSLIGERM